MSLMLRVALTVCLLNAAVLAKWGDDCEYHEQCAKHEECRPWYDGLSPTGPTKCAPAKVFWPSNACLVNADCHNENLRCKEDSKFHPVLKRCRRLTIGEMKEEEREIVFGRSF